jgi:high affinity Mn2+ porin
VIVRTVRRLGIPIVAIAAATMSVAIPALGADAARPMPVKAPERPPYYDWTGFYFGGHVGYGLGNARATLSDPFVMGSHGAFGSLYGGIQGGYNYLLPSRVLLGIEADISFPNYLGSDDIAWSGITPTTFIQEKIDYLGTLRGRMGYTFGHWLVYATGGFAWSQGRFLQSPGVSDDADKVLRTRTGGALGTGIEVAIAPDWTSRIEYLYRRFGTANVVFPSDTHYASMLDIHTVRVGLNRKFGGEKSDVAATGSNGEFGNWEIHGQTTYIQQGYPAFRSLYYGQNSLTPWPQTRNTWTVSAFLAVRLWEGGEFYYNPELFQGFGLNSTVGAGGFPNGEAQKSNFPYSHYDTSRLFLRQTFGLGGDQESVESDYGQMAGKKDISRLTFQIGKFAVHDVFDNNAYATDPRVHFFNWSLWAGGAFDYAADLVGLAYGAVAELNQKHWALRGGYFLIGDKPNSNNFDTTVFKRGGYVVELETRYSLFSQPGKFRVIGWANSYFSGSYREAVDMTLANPGLDPTAAIIQTRQGRTKYGYVFNVEQAVTDDIGLFGRWSWNNGKNEISAFTDIDSSLSFGTSIKGTGWGRPDDKIGLAGAINGLSKDHRDFLAAGGLGILIGDGRLNYRLEQIIEAYYAMTLRKGVMLTFDYQFMKNPAYNADRGPVSIYAARLHAEF